MVGHMVPFVMSPWPHVLWKYMNGSHPLTKTWDLLIYFHDFHGSGRQTSALGVKMVAKFFHGRQWGKTMPASADLSVLHPSTLLQTTEMCSFGTIMCITPALGNTRTAICFMCVPRLKFVFSLLSREAVQRSLKGMSDQSNSFRLEHWGFSHTKPFSIEFPEKQPEVVSLYASHVLDMSCLKGFWAQRQVSFAVTQGRDEADLGPWCSPVHQLRESQVLEETTNITNI